jgi:dTDP-4-dehydrorhamnose 3,5-epimerase
MVVTELELPGVKLIVPKRHDDDRGFFSETYSQSAFAAAGIADAFVQDNHSRSRAPGTLRGLHFQSPPHAQGKLVRVSCGRILDVAVDIRRGSPAFGRHVAVELSADNWHQLWVPAGFAHGYVTIEPDTEVQYKVTSPYAPSHDAGIAWDDPALAIAWPVTTPALSPKDQRLPRLTQIVSPFVYAPETP